MMTAKEIIVTRGEYQGREGLEILFEDHSEAPLSITLTDSSCIGLLPGNPGCKPWNFAVWMWMDGCPRMVYSSVAYIREGKDLPDLRSLEQFPCES